MKVQLLILGCTKTTSTWTSFLVTPVSHGVLFVLFSAPMSIIPSLHQCIIKKIRQPHLEKNSTASRRGGGSRRPQPSSLHNCGFSDFSLLQEYSSTMDRDLKDIGKVLSLCNCASGFCMFLYVASYPKKWRDSNRFFVQWLWFVHCYGYFCFFLTAGEHVWEILIIMTQVLHLKGNKKTIVVIFSVKKHLSHMSGETKSLESV